MSKMLLRIVLAFANMLGHQFPLSIWTFFRGLQLAPSASNRQNWEFVFIGDPNLKRSLVPACYHQSFVGECTYFIAAVADPRLKWHQVDITIALTNFTLQTTELGYGTCWIGAFNEAMVKELLGVPEGQLICNRQCEITNQAIRTI